ncbi:class I SAM-dependent methyltransferase [Microtetraspora niveoalba]|uniref:class I SAM-dependent methyltransferase n=1 Tax=Microtetraspora niveoalba TaxID=46175 RepID=UPI00082C4AF0|nr:class I SAM-dependent methyltransferase [Microtetraspora niveoalba]
MTRSPEFPPEILDYYLRGREDGRLRSGRGRLEFWRTQDVLRRVLPPAPARVLDVGGGSGVHAEWLAADGHRVEVVDPVPMHVEMAARLPGVVARMGDARTLEDADGSADAVLLLGPLYHLTDRADRVRALAEARRVVRPGGVVAAATISRWAAVHDMIRSGRYAEESVRAVVDDSARHGLLRGNERIGFTTAYFHDPDEILGEFADAGLPEARRYALENVFGLYADIDEWLDDPERRGMILDVARRSEGEPTLLGVAGHMLTVARA